MSAVADDAGETGTTGEAKKPAWSAESALHCIRKLLRKRQSFHVSCQGENVFIEVDAGESPLADDPEALRREAVDLIDYAWRLRNDPTLDWVARYDVIFSPFVSCRLMAIFAKLDINFRYVDPDTTYKADIEAFLDALQMQRLKLLLDKTVTI